ncbi:N-acyl-D-aspartate/D-glutamate deacylase [Brachybacterium vulturis]|uniref:N-acyl-D-aspartate/D-glutamate deacylase n=1 Tax=Brachybacterium vulturis TaxID=2017484 RepID=A0A291GJJ8_9MICO|nr:amidohydrolase family protein [Brachybacterium vulturis]ATG50154.1 N-acyl-D-aspartate/D-glutamate deacylase [Brachybacterium vulturis]
MSAVLLRGGRVVAPDGLVRADVLVEGARITAVGRIDPSRARGAQVLEADGRLVMPGFIDAHSHADGAVFEPEVQLALLRQGVTSVIGGQDGVSYAPGDGTWASEYFAAINGPHPTFRGGSVADLLATYDDAVPLNVAYLVPAGTVRHQVMGGAEGPADPAERAAMTALVARAVADGAVGLSTGLDYTPGLFADAEEIAALCSPLAAAGLPYVTHMRGGYEENSQVGIEETVRIGRAAGVPVHISHFHTRAAEAERLMGLLARAGVEASFDAYPYTRGCSLLGMTLLPPALNAMAPGEASALLRDPARRELLRREWFPAVAHHPSLGPDWPELLTIAHTVAEEFAWAPGLTLAQVAVRRGTDPIDAALDLLSASALEVNVVMAVRDQRPVEDLGRLLAHPRHLGGSDGIFVGAHPHPRSRGAFASYLATYVREHGFLDWTQAAQHLSSGAAERFRLGERGAVAEGFLADLVLVDPAAVTDRATYQDPLAIAVGIQDVLVAGRPVLAGGRLTGELPGRGLRAAPRRPDTAAAPHLDGVACSVPPLSPGSACAAPTNRPLSPGEP